MMKVTGKLFCLNDVKAAHCTPLQRVNRKLRAIPVTYKHRDEVGDVKTVGGRALLLTVYEHLDKHAKLILFKQHTAPWHLGAF